MVNASLPIWAQYVQALGPAVAAIAAAGIVFFIQFRQWKTASDKLKLDLFDRRYRMLEAVLNILSEVVQAGRPTWEQLHVFHNQVLEARFLFRDPLVIWFRSIEAEAEDLL